MPRIARSPFLCPCSDTALSRAIVAGHVRCSLRAGDVLGEPGAQIHAGLAERCSLPMVVLYTHVPAYVATFHAGTHVGSWRNVICSAEPALLHLFITRSWDVEGTCSKILAANLHNPAALAIVRAHTATPSHWFKEEALRAILLAAARGTEKQYRRDARRISKMYGACFTMLYCVAINGWIHALRDFVLRHPQDAVRWAEIVADPIKGRCAPVIRQILYTLTPGVPARVAWRHLLDADGTMQRELMACGGTMSNILLVGIGQLSREDPNAPEYAYLFALFRVKCRVVMDCPLLVQRDLLRRVEQNGDHSSSVRGPGLVFLRRLAAGKPDPFEVEDADERLVLRREANMP